MLLTAETQAFYTALSVSLFAKNLFYPPVLNTERGALLFTGQAVTLAQMLGSVGVQAFTELLLMYTHSHGGMTYVVQRGVTDDLDLTDFVDPHFENLPWPSDTIEFNFEDPSLGTVLIGHLRRKDMLNMADRLGVKLVGHATLDTHEHELIVLAHCSDGSGSCIMVHDENTWQNLLGGERMDMTPRGHGDGKMTSTETEELIRLTLLCFKVLAYASIPQFKPQAVTPGQLRRGEGKAGVKGRPKLPTFRVVYLPHVVHPTAPRPLEEGEPTGAHREFKGRRGHIRWFHSDFYVKMKGKWIYVPPVVVAGTEHVVAKVRKP